MFRRRVQILRRSILILRHNSNTIRHIKNVKKSINSNFTRCRKWIKGILFGLMEYQVLVSRP